MGAAPHLRPQDQITNMTWSPTGDSEALGHKLLAHYSIREGQITYCFVCHR